MGLGAYFGGPYLSLHSGSSLTGCYGAAWMQKLTGASGFLHRFAFQRICFDNSSVLVGAFVKYFNWTLVLQPWWEGFMSGSKMSDVTAFRLQLGATPRLWMIELAALKKKAQVAVTTWS